jgi:tetratricopeptide (TPR) repeat protein
LLSDKNDLLTEATLQEMEHRHLLPESLESLFIKTYDNLPDDSQTVIKIAAILTNSFNVEDLKVYLPQPMHAKLDSILNNLVSLRLLTVKTINPQAEYIFPNNIVREAIYRTILLSEKKHLHNIIAHKLIESLSGRVDEQLETIAEHFIKAQEKKLIAIWALRAGQKLLNLADYESAIYYLIKTLEASTDESITIQTHLMLLEAYVFQAKTKEAKAEIDLLASLEEKWQPLSDRYYWLYNRYLHCITEYSTAMKKIKVWLRKVRDYYYHCLLKIDFIELLLELEQRDEFEKKALEYYNELFTAKDEIYKTKLTAILGRFYLESGDYLKAGEFYQLRLNFALQQHDLLGQRLALTSLGIISSRLGDKKAALKLYSKALEIAEHLGDRNGYSKILLDMGVLYRNEGKYNMAMECYEKSLKLSEITQNRVQKATLIYDIGELCYYLGEYLVALDYFKKSKKLSEEIGDEIGITFCNDAMGDILFTQRRMDEAKDLYNRNLKLQIRLKDKEGIGHTLGNLGNIAKGNADFAVALKFYKKQLALVTEVGDKEDMGRATFNIATLDVEQHKYAKALKTLNQALLLFQECEAAYYIEITEKLISEVKSKIEP